MLGLRGTSWTTVPRAPISSCASSLPPIPPPASDAPAASGQATPAARAALANAKNHREHLREAGIERSDEHAATARFGARMGAAEVVDSMVLDGLTDAFNHIHMGLTAEPEQRDRAPREGGDRDHPPT